MIRAKEIIVHENYDHQTSDYDIALIRVSTNRLKFIPTRFMITFN